MIEQLIGKPVKLFTKTSEYEGILAGIRTGPDSKILYVIIEGEETRYFVFERILSIEVTENDSRTSPDAPESIKDSQGCDMTYGPFYGSLRGSE